MANQDAVSSLIMGEEESKPIEKKAANANNYNYGNIRPQGATTGFQVHETPEQGLKAIDDNLKAYGKKNINTLSKIISTWSPPSQNDTPRLIKQAAQRLSLDPNQELDMNNPAVRQALGTAIMMQEGVVKFKKNAESNPEIKTEMKPEAPIATQPEQTGDAVSNLIMSAEPVKEEKKSSPFGYGLKPAEVLKNLKPAAPSIAPQLQPPAVPLQETQADIDARRGLEAIQPSMKVTPKPEQEITAKDVLMAPVQLAGQGVSRAIGATIGGVAALGKDIFSRVTTGKPLTQQEINKTYETFTNVPYEELNPASKKVMEYIAPIAEKLPPIVPGAPEVGLMAQVGKTAQVAKQIEKAIPPSARKPKVTLAEVQAQFKAKKEAEAKLAAEPTPGEPTQMAGGGAAAVSQENQRIGRAQELPIPIDLSKDQATRNPADVRFARETAKSPTLGQPLQEHYANQNKLIQQNLDHLAEETGAELIGTNPGDLANHMIKIVVPEKAKRKTEYSNAYTEARNAGEMEQPIDISKLKDYAINHEPEAINAPIIKSLELKINNLAKEGNAIPLNDLEEVRKMVTRLSGDSASNSHFGKEINGLIDSLTENAGGEKYQKARSLFSKYRTEFEDTPVIKSITAMKKGTTQRAVALEDLINKSVISGSLDDVQKLFGTLENIGPEGKQMANELKGFVANKIKEEATKNIQLDINGKRYVSTKALDNIIVNLDKSGKLDYLFGKKNAEHYRTLNQVTKDVQTVPQGTTNPSGSASSILAALGEMGAQTALTGVPIPVAMIGKHIYGKHKTGKELTKISEFINYGKKNQGK